ncbi:MAG: hypothetical protein K2K59_01530, partial [Muribaculaceae bacterium]|nr:hypothetical protein [Muribaculaceae bacterium]
MQRGEPFQCGGCSNDVTSLQTKLETTTKTNQLNNLTSTILTIMKKALLMAAVLLGSMTTFAQNIDKNELKQLANFLNQPSAEAGKTNAEVLKITNLKTPAAWEGVTIENGHV